MDLAKSREKQMRLQVKRKQNDEIIKGLEKSFRVSSIVVLLMIAAFLLLPIFGNSQTSQTVCEGSAWPSITVNCNGGTTPYTVTWTSPNGVETTGATKTLDTVGVWTWMCEDAASCVSNGGTHTILFENDPTEDLEILADTVCIAVNQTISASGVPAGYTYNWSFGSGASPSTSTAANTNVIYSSGGTKTITLNISKNFTGTGSGCNETCTWQVTRNILVGNLTGSVTCN